MTQRFTVDRSSFEAILSATWMLQEVNRRALPVEPAAHDGQPLAELVEMQQAIEMESLDLESAIQRIAGLAGNLGRATGASVWLLNGDALQFRGGAGIGAADPHLRSQLESRLISLSQARSDWAPQPAGSAQWNLSGDAMHYPGSMKSLLVVPIYQGRRVAGALAVFSTLFDAFRDADAVNARLLSGLLARAVGKAAEAELKHSVILERAALRQAVDRLIPALMELVEKDRHPGGTDVAPIASLLASLSAQSTSTAVPQTAAIADRVAAVELETQPEVRIVEEVAHPAAIEVREDRIVTAGDVSGEMTEVVEARPGSSFSEQPEGGEPGVISAPASATSANELLEPAQVASTPTRIAAGVMLRAFVRTVRETWKSTRAAWKRQSLFAVAKIRREISLASAQLRAQIGVARAAVETGMVRGRARLVRAPSLELRVRVPGNLRWKLRLLSTAAIPTTVMITMFVFLFLTTFGNNASHPTVVSAEASAPVRAAAVPAPKPAEMIPPSKPAAAISATTSGRLQPSSESTDAVAASPTHLRITDPALSSELFGLSRYEIAALRRQADYGDDSAAMLLGMAYETGRFVPQSCAKAAEWVTKAATAGNTAAQYNLGLRYRYADGVAVDALMAENWLKKAAAHHNARAQAALELMRR